MIWFACLRIYKILFLLFVKINVAFPLANLLLCTFVLPWLLPVLFICWGDEIKTIYRSTFLPLASITAALAAFGLLCCRRSFTCLLLWFPKWRAEDQVTSPDLTLAPTPSLILTICEVSEHINLYHNCLRGSGLPR